MRPRHLALTDSLLPRLKLDLSLPFKVKDVFSSNLEGVELEIGFGGGEHLVLQAQNRPHIGFIGCEPFINGMAKALAAVETLGLPNIRLYDGDALDVLAWLPDASLRRIYLLYPDPWPKKRHWKRRFICEASLAEMARVLESGGELFFATDWADYASWTLQHVLHSSDFTWTALQADDWRKPWFGWRSTRYEAKALREGRRPCYLRFERRRAGSDSMIPS